MKLSFLSALALLFIALKLLGYIDWSWWLVLLPLYFGVLVVFGFLFLGFIGVLFGATLTISKNKGRK